jgi:D-inositol-3-phosphate glycosyltransferase
LQTTVRDRITGVLVPDHDPVSLADALELMLNDAALRARLGREGVRWAAQHHWPCVAEAVCREYAALAAAAAFHLDTGRCH